MAEVKFPIPRSSDQDYYRALYEISEHHELREAGLSDLIIRFGSDFAPEFKANIEALKTSEDVGNMLTDTGQFVREMTLRGGSYSVTFVRQIDFNNGTSKTGSDIVVISSPDPHKNSLGAKLVKAIHGAVARFSFQNLRLFLDDQSTEHFRAREEALNRLESLQKQLIVDYHSRQKHQLDFLEEQRLATNVELQAAKEEHSRQINLEMAKLLEAKEELDARKKNLDDRQSTHVRRELREQLKKIIQQRQNEFALSKDARQRRIPVVVGYITLLTVLLGFSIFYSFRDATQASGVDYFITGPKIGMMIGFVVTFGFFLNWMNKWAQTHAEEEFKLRQFDLDFDRASWVVEMAFEWNDAKQSPIPESLAETLSSNLFGERSSSPDTAMTGSDAVAKALASLPNSSAEINFPGGKITLDKRAMRRARRHK